MIYEVIMCESWKLCFKSGLISQDELSVWLYTVIRLPLGSGATDGSQNTILCVRSASYIIERN